MTEAYRALKLLPWVAECEILMREHGRYILAEAFVRPAENAPPATEATRIIRETLLPLDWRLQHLAAELTDDVKTSKSYCTHEELKIES